MKHGDAKLLHPDISMLMLHCNIVRQTVILGDGRVIYRNVCDTLRKIRNRIAPDFHHLLHQRIGGSDRTGWIIHELCLSMLPGVGELISLLFAQWLDVKFFDAGLPLLQNFLPSCRIPFSAGRTFVFRPELRA